MKTPGEIAYSNHRLYKGLTPTWPLANGQAKSEMAAWEAAANAVLEEAAKVADEHAAKNRQLAVDHSSDQPMAQEFMANARGAEQAAALIRSLMCQAPSVVTGGDGIGAEAPLQAEDGGEAEEEVHDSSGCVWCDLGLPIVSLNYKTGHEAKDGVLYFCDKTKGQIEEPQRSEGDEVELQIDQPA